LFQVFNNTELTERVLSLEKRLRKLENQVKQLTSKSPLKVTGSSRDGTAKPKRFGG